jgi:hypothetical protein
MILKSMPPSKAGRPAFFENHALKQRDETPCRFSLKAYRSSARFCRARSGLATFFSWLWQAAVLHRSAGALHSDMGCCCAAVVKSLAENLMWPDAGFSQREVGVNRDLSRIVLHR